MGWRILTLDSRVLVYDWIVLMFEVHGEGESTILAPIAIEHFDDGGEAIVLRHPGLLNLGEYTNIDDADLLIVGRERKPSDIATELYAVNRRGNLAVVLLRLAGPEQEGAWRRWAQFSLVAYAAPIQTLRWEQVLAIFADYLHKEKGLPLDEAQKEAELRILRHLEDGNRRLESADLVKQLQPRRNLALYVVTFGGDPHAFAGQVFEIPSGSAVFCFQINGFCVGGTKIFDRRRVIPPETAVFSVAMTEHVLPWHKKYAAPPKPDDKPVSLSVGYGAVVWSVYPVASWRHVLVAAARHLIQRENFLSEKLPMPNSKNNPGQLFVRPYELTPGLLIETFANIEQICAWLRQMALNSSIRDDGMTLTLWFDVQMQSGTKERLP